MEPEFMSQRKFSRRSALMAGVAGLALTPLAGSPAQAQDFSANTGPKVYLDPGHGGRDSGAAANGMKEKWLTLAIARIARDNLLASGYRVRMSRNGDIYRDLPYRVNDANSWGAAVFVSIHINSARSANTGTGFESYRSPGASDRTKNFHNLVHWEVLNRMRLSDSSIRDRGKQNDQGFYVLLHTNMPAVLTENLFINHTRDANLLRQDAFIRRVGIGHALGIRRFFGERVT
jgi:N-acetylmuramoyl-L-alanine amidase